MVVPMQSENQEKKHLIVGTSGHIDHGKTSLIKALTGVDADTLAEEKARGITIELGFVFMPLPDPNWEVLFIDVPGHERLVKTMVAGAANLDAALFVIAADEGINLQTKEHFDILKILDIPKGIIALTKSDLVDEQTLSERTEEIQAFVQGSFLESAPIVPVSSLTGDGTENIKEELFKISLDIRDRTDTEIFRMPVDRVFTMQGFGTVIAGTILSGTVQIGDAVEVYPDGITTKIRGIQVHGDKREKSVIGKRTAINLLNVEKSKLRRGQCLGFTGTLVPTNRVDAKFNLLPSSKELKNLSRVRFYTGTSETLCRVAILNQARIGPGDTAHVQFILEKPVVALPGDRYVIRTLSPLFTVGGGTIIDINPPKHQRFDKEMIGGLKKLEGDIDEQIEQLICNSELSAIPQKEILLFAGRHEKNVNAAIQRLVSKGVVFEHLDGNTTRFLHKIFFETLCDMFVRMIEKYFSKNPGDLEAPYNELRSEMLKSTDQHTFRFILDNLIQNEKIERKGTNIALCDYQIPLDESELITAEKIENFLIESGIEAPVESKIAKDLNINPKVFVKVMAALVNRGAIIRLSDKVTYHMKTVEEVKKIVLNLLSKRDSITLAELRDELSVSRKYTQAIMEYLSANGITKRVGDKHVLP